MLTRRDHKMNIYRFATCIIPYFVIDGGHILVEPTLQIPNFFSMNVTAPVLEKTQKHTQL